MPGHQPNCVCSSLLCLCTIGPELHSFSSFVLGVTPSVPNTCDFLTRISSYPGMLLRVGDYHRACHCHCHHHANQGHRAPRMKVSMVGKCPSPLPTEMMGRAGREGREWKCLIGQTSASSDGTTCELQDASLAISPYLTHS